MKIEQILYSIETGDMALPEFQRGYVWNREQVRSLFELALPRLPSRQFHGLATTGAAKQRGGLADANATIKMLLDGQQRHDLLYGVIRGKPPRFFDGNAQAFTGLYFHLEDETFEFYAPLKMKNDPRVDRRHGSDAEGHCRTWRVRHAAERTARAGDEGLAESYVERLNTLLSIRERRPPRRGGDRFGQDTSTWSSTSSTESTAAARSYRRATSRWRRSAPTGPRRASR